MHDHTGNFGGSDPAVGGLTTPELQQGDNDYAVGQVVQTIVDAHRSTAYVVGPYVKKKAVVGSRYSTVNMVRTIEDILGIDHLNLNDAYQPPMTKVFDLTQATWSFTAGKSAYLNGTVGKLLGVDRGARFVQGPALKPAHGAAWWAKATRGLDWSDADEIAVETGDADSYNRIEWEGVKPGVRYPTRRSVADLRARTIATTGTTAGPAGAGGE